MVNTAHFVSRPIPWISILLWGQGLYYLVTAIWPLIDILSFQQVTGPKTDHLVTGRESDHWLVYTVAVLILAISLVLLKAAWSRAHSSEVILLAVLSAIGLTTIDVVFVMRQTIDRIYLADAVAEVVLLVGWITACLFGRRKTNLSSGSKVSPAA